MLRIKKPNVKKPPDVQAMAFLNEARAFHKAAKTLHAAYEQEEQNARVTLDDPVYFCYFHTVELTLKAFLRFHGLLILGTKRESHKLTELYKECESLGLRVGPSDRLSTGNVVSLLESPNVWQRVSEVPLLQPQDKRQAGLGEVVGALMEAVSARVDDRLPPGPAATFHFIVGKPREHTR